MCDQQTFDGEHHCHVNARAIRYYWPHDEYERDACFRAWEQLDELDWLLENTAALHVDCVECDGIGCDRCHGTGVIEVDDAEAFVWFDAGMCVHELLAMRDVARRQSNTSVSP